jgi:hypothetical protein
MFTKQKGQELEHGENGSFSCISIHMVIITMN